MAVVPCFPLQSADCSAIVLAGCESLSEGPTGALQAACRRAVAVMPAPVSFGRDFTSDTFASAEIENRRLRVTKG